MALSVVKKLLIAIFVNCLYLIFAFGQGDSDAAFDASIRQQIDQPNWQRSFPSRPTFRRRIEPTKLGKELLKPAEKDYAESKEFLGKSKTGIAKIFSDAKCDRFIIDAADSKCIQAAQMLGQGSYYSFRIKENIAAYWSDIYFANGSFSIVNTLGSLGFFVDLGNLPIESIDKSSPQLTKLQKYQLPKTSFALKAEKAKLIEASELFTGKVKVKLNTTYALRAAYWTDRYYGGEDIDILIVLRVIRENEDGSVTFLWRELQRKGTSKLIISDDKK